MTLAALITPPGKVRGAGDETAVEEGREGRRERNRSRKEERDKT